MKVAVLTLTRDRLDYTKHCFASLREHAGCLYDHYVLDQGSGDGTRAWLTEQDELEVFALDDNIGIAAGLNYLLDRINLLDYDVVVKVDNDCELVQPNTLRDVCRVAAEADLIVSPRILGLNNPPAVRGELAAAGETLLDITQIGGIFMAVPAWVYDDFRYNENVPPWGGDDIEICHWWRTTYHRPCGYVKRLEAWHYRGTDGQHDDYPDYFAARVAAGGPA